MLPDSTEELTVFQASPEAPATVTEFDDSAFGRRDAELTPLIVASARKLKRVLADEQNDVLHVLRSAKKAVALDDLLPAEADHVRHYADAVADELRKAALAGAASIGDGTAKERAKAAGKAEVLQPAVDTLGTAIVRPLRERLERAVVDADGDNRRARTGRARRLPRVEDAAHRRAPRRRGPHGLRSRTHLPCSHRALRCAGWSTRTGPTCPDAEDNALAGVVAAGDPFPTDHVCAPAHEGCRCMLQRAPR